jgi:hypothetical protein
LRHRTWSVNGRTALAGLATALVLSLAAFGLAATPAHAAQSTESGQAAAPAPTWVRTTKETRLWSGPDDRAKEFSTIASGTTLQVLEVGPRRAFVYFAGDKQGHPPGEVWVDRADLASASWPQWLRARRNAEIRPEPSPAGPGTVAIATGTYVETTGEAQGRWARVFYLGDGRLDGAIEGWIDSADFVLPPVDQTALTGYLLSKGALSSREPDVWLRVPYRTQLDGTDYAAANCGPTSVGMALEAFGGVYAQELLRAAAMQLQDTADCDECGVFIQNLATLVQQRGAQVVGLRKDGSPPRPVTELDRADEATLRRWTLEDVRAELRNGRVVLPQVKYRALPDRADSAYRGDHFVVITGMIGDRFIYNDPIDSDGRGYARLIRAETLERAMSLASVPKAAFAAGR